MNEIIVCLAVIALGIIAGYIVGGIDWDSHLDFMDDEEDEE